MEVFAGFLEAGLVEAGFLEAGLVEAGLVSPPFKVSEILELGLVEAGFDVAGFVVAGFVAAGFVAAGFVAAGTWGPYDLPPYPPFAFRRNVVLGSAVDLPALATAETGDDGRIGPPAPLVGTLILAALRAACMALFVRVGVAERVTVVVPSAVAEVPPERKIDPTVAAVCAVPKTSRPTPPTMFPLANSLLDLSTSDNPGTTDIRPLLNLSTNELDFWVALPAVFVVAGGLTISESRGPITIDSCGPMVLAAARIWAICCGVYPVGDWVPKSRRGGKSVASIRLKFLRSSGVPVGRSFCAILVRPCFSEARFSNR